MKMKRLLASVLALLLVVSILPIGALAVDIETGANEEWVNIPIDNNRGTIGENVSTITNNGTSGDGPDSGTVNKNAGTITNNYGTVQSNASADESYHPTIFHNHGLVVKNNGLVENNRMNGEVATNNGTVSNNNGQVGATKTTTDPNTGDEIEEIVSDTGNFGTITTNGKTGTVLVNQKGGTIGNNCGTVNINSDGGLVITNSNVIEQNNGDVGYTYDMGDGFFGVKGGNEGTIKLNAGTVTSNEGTIELNAGTVTSNAVGAEIEKNTDTLEMNYGTVDENTGTVEYNFEVGEVTNKSGGEVTYNRGTVNNEKDGTLYEYFTEFADGEEPETDKPSKTITEEGTYYGILIDKGTAPEAADAGTWKNGFALVQKKLGEVLDLGSIFKQDGYEVIGYQDASPVEMALDEDAAGPEMVSGTEYNENRPSWLRLIWGKIKAAVKPSASSDDPEPKTVQNNIPTSLSAGQVKVGAYVRRGNLLFRIIEVTDNDIQVATVGKLSDEALADMLGFLKQHLSDAQIAKINGEPKLLEQELVTYFFGDSYEHIAFRAAKDLFE